MRTMFSINEILGKIIGRQKQIIQQNNKIEKSQKNTLSKKRNFTFHLLMSDSDKKPQK